MKTVRALIVIAAVLLSGEGIAQEKSTPGDAAVWRGTSQPLSVLLAGPQPQCSSGKDSGQGKSSKKQRNLVFEQASGLDKLLHDSLGLSYPIQKGSWDGYSSQDNEPFNCEDTGKVPDTEGDVGPNHYIQWNNKGFKIFDKSGGQLANPGAGNLLWSEIDGESLCKSNNNGDPIVLYDHLAGRWIWSQFALDSEVVDGHYVHDNYQCLAISTSSDPLGTYELYELHWGPTLNDYPKLSVWQNAYYLTFNEYQWVEGQHSWDGYWDYSGAVFGALDRSTMLSGTGQDVPFVYNRQNGAASELLGTQPVHREGSGSGSDPAGLFVKAIDRVGQDDIYRVWKASPNWTSKSLDVSHLIDIPTTDFTLACQSSSACVPQMGGSSVNPLSYYTMYRAQHRYHGSYETIVVSHTVDTSGGSGPTGIRWAELIRNTSGGPWSLHQTGTYAPDQHWRFMPSVAMDQAGNICAIYSVSSGSKFPSVAYACHDSSEDLRGQMGVEIECGTGSGPMNEGSAWGDYSSLSVDPSNQCVFYGTAEYVNGNDGRWDSRICKFEVSGCYDPMPQAIGEVGSVSVSHVPVTVHLRRTFSDPVVFAQPPSTAGGNTSVVRITDVNTDSFTLYVHESPNMDGAHVFETVHYLVLEAGTWSIGDTVRLEVGVTTTSAMVGKHVSNQWMPVSFSSLFTSTPAVISQVQTNNDPYWVKTRQQSMTASGFEVGLEEEEKTSAGGHGLHLAEEVGWLAIEAADGSWSGITFAAATTSRAVTNNWYALPSIPGVSSPVHLVASLASYYGGDPASLRHKLVGSYEFQVKIEEDTCYDSEVGHTTEQVSYLQLGSSGLLKGFVRNEPKPPLSVSATQPPSLTVDLGDSASFSVAASGGSPPYSYQWQVGTTSAHNNFYDIGNWGGYSGAFTSQMSIATAEEIHTGWYRCKLTDGVDTVYSTPAQLTVEVPVATTMVARDLFTNNSTDRKVGDPLRLTTTDAGGNLTWSAGQSVVLGINHVTHTTDVPHCAATLPFDPSSFSGNRVAIVEAGVHPTGPEWSPWAAIGFSKSLTGNFWSDGQVWMYLRVNGNLAVYANGTTHQLVSTQASYYNPNGYNHLKLEYDWVSHTVSAWANGVKVLDSYDLDTLGLTPAISRAGLHLASTKPGTELYLDSFELSVATGMSQ
jgi:hypothetical protein